MRTLVLAIGALAALVVSLAGTTGAVRHARTVPASQVRVEAVTELRERALPTSARGAHAEPPIEAERVAVAILAAPPPPLDDRNHAVLQGRVGTSPATLVLVTGPDRGRRVDTDATGAFRVDGLAPGPVVVAVDSRELGPCERRVRLSNVRPATLTLAVGPPRAVRGRVVDVEGRPIAGATVTIDGVMTSTTSDGAFAHEQTVAGRAIARVRAPGFAPAAAELLAHGERPVEFVLERGAALLVLAREAGEIDLTSLERPRPVRGAAATLVPWTTPRVLRAGEQLFLEGLAPGRARVSTRASQEQRSIELRLATQEAASLDLAGG